MRAALMVVGGGWPGMAVSDIRSRVAWSWSSVISPSSTAFRPT
jgi:hypothetical protein